VIVWFIKKEIKYIQYHGGNMKKMGIGRGSQGIGGKGL
jgi:hypothetical protein